MRAKITLKIFDEKKKKWVLVMDDKEYNEVEYNVQYGIREVPILGRWQGEVINDGSEAIVLRAYKKPCI